MISKIICSLSILLAMSFASNAANAFTFSYTDALNIYGNFVVSNSGFIAATDNYTGSLAIWNGTTLNDIPTLPNATSTELTGINDSGQVVGNSYLTEFNSSINHATLWNNGTVTNLADAYGLKSTAASISNSGVVFGTSDILINGIPQTQDTQWANGTVTYNTNPASPASPKLSPTLNLSNAFAQNYSIVNGDGSVINLGSLSGGATAYLNLNSSGQAVGSSAITTPNPGYYGGVTTTYHATFWNGTTAIDLGTLNGYSNSYATGINELGQIIGYSTNTALSSWDLKNMSASSKMFNRQMINNSPGLIPTLWNGTTAIDLNSLVDPSLVANGFSLNTAYLLASGTIIGTANNPNACCNVTVYSLAAVPEADTSAMLLMGAGVMGFIARRRKQQLN